MRNLFYYPGLVPLLSFLFAFIITYVSIPSMVRVAQTKHIFDEPNGRTSHSVNTPTLGGMAIFAGFIVSVMVFVYIPDIPYVQYVIAGIIIMFFIGLKDDIVTLAPMTKFIAQIFAAAIIVDLGDIRLHGLYGFMGITDIGYYGSDFLSIFVIIAIINAFNLIDGIDGLSGGIGVLANLTFGFWFLLTDNIQLAILSFALTGSLLAFLRFNLFSVKNKIFMGDTGALVVGFIMAVLVIKFNDLNGICTGPYKIGAAPAVSIGILIVPIFDTVRVFILRILKGKSPFLPDKQHVHHYLVKLTGSHKKSTSIILLVNVAFIVISLLLSGLRIYQLTLILFALAAILSYIPFVMVKKKRVTQ
ncbi:MAG: undecaprenyl/decaprenyl-phosphate alpha-N-acetylglucosaminyl 1-phosphate transferase [Bacteroidetes bacterium]|nr:MAG: undecaprenyl/decaprenyl-phosphate alpha-N-acetylglucosaminyl 1-phosphate transferase [Bacteroidota bacterium]